MIRICIVTFNVSNLLELQVKLWRKYLDCEIVVIDNSNNFEVSKQIKALCKHLSVEFLKVGIIEGDSSRSHGWACNVAYNLFNDCDVIGLVDHDIFPFKPVDLSFMNTYDIAGIQQIREQFIYLWPGLIFIRPELGDIDFLPTRISGVNLDTGAGTHKIKEGVKYLQEVHVNYGGEDIYSEIENVFMHFSNGSNWKGDWKHGEKIGKLVEILNNKCE